MAADQGDFEAMHSLGELYAEGRGVPRSRVLALALYFYGAQKGGELARVYGERMEKELSPDDVVRARRLAERFEEAGAVSGIIDKTLKKN
jgi:TPR repeat protein